MVDLQTDEEKAEAIKTWWKDNGLAVITGVALGLSAIFGWRAWIGYQERLGQQASLAFEELLMTVSQSAARPVDAETEGDNPLLIVAREQNARLNEDFSATPYAFLAQLAMAKAYNDQGELAAAAEALQSAIGQAPSALLKTLAALRLARVLVAAGDDAAATKLIEDYGQNGAFAADFAALRGDLARAGGQVAEARVAYEQALAGDAGAGGLIRLKLQELPESTP